MILGGKLIFIDGTGKDGVGIKNLYRYRGYRYDTETGLYYLQSRYYNPEWGRFINSDAIAGKIGELLGHNLFVYCKNNSVNMSDLEGFRPIPIVGSEFDTTTMYTIDPKSPPPTETGYVPPKNPDKGKKNSRT